MMNTAQMDTIPLSSDSESGNEPSRPSPRQCSPPNPPSDDEDPVTPTSRLASMPARYSAPSGQQLDAKSTLGPTPDLIPRSEADSSSPNRGRESGGPSCAGGESDAQEVDEEADEEKQRLIAQVLELQHTLEDLSARVDSVKEENLKLRSENQILGQYIENLMAASSVFQSSTPRMRRKASGTAGANKAAVLKLQQQE